MRRRQRTILAASMTSGKIVRRVLKAVGLDLDSGDVSTIEDEGSVDEARRAVEDLRAGLVP